MDTIAAKAGRGTNPSPSSIITEYLKELANLMLIHSLCWTGLNANLIGFLASSQSFCFKANLIAT